MANTTSGTYIFDKTFSIDEVIQEAYERIGLEPMSGNNMKTARRSLNILFSEWGNRGLHYWEIAVNSVTLIENQNEYIFYRSPGDGTSSAVQTTLSSVIDNAVTTIPLVSVYGFPTSGTIQIDSEEITYTGISLLSLTGATRGANGTAAASHASGTTVYNYDTLTYGVDDIEEASYRNIISSATNPIDSPLTKINRSAYQAFSNKLATGQPTQYWVQRFIDRVTFTLYTTPGASQAGNQIFYYYKKRIQDIGAYTNATDIPYRFVPCMCAGLAYYLSQKQAPQRTQELKMLYEDELKRALEEDGSSSSSFITPRNYYPNI
jgi:hypothetical protein